jgi:hypothetical protein
MVSGLKDHCTDAKNITAMEHKMVAEIATRGACGPAPDPARAAPRRPSS